MKTILDEEEYKNADYKDRNILFIEKYEEEEEQRKQEFLDLVSKTTRNKMNKLGKNEVYFENTLHNMNLASLGTKGQDIFYYICALVRNQKDTSITVTFTKIKENIGMSRQTNEKMITILTRVSLLLNKMMFFYDSEDIRAIGNIFTEFIIDKKNDTLTVRVSDTWLKVFNELETAQYTKLGFKEFLEIKSKHGKSLYTMLKRWQYQGMTQTYDLDYLKYKLDAKSYSNRDFMNKVFLPAISECQKYFSNLKMHKDGDKFYFTFVKEKGSKYKYVKTKDGLGKLIVKE